MFSDDQAVFLYLIINFPTVVTLREYLNEISVCWDKESKITDGSKKVLLCTAV